MRVLHVHSGNLYGGIETMLSTIARRRDACPAMEPQFALCFEGRLSEELKESGARLHMLPGVRISRPASVVRARRALASLLSEGGFDVTVCHSAWTHSIFGGVVRASLLPLVFWSHGALEGRHWLERWARLTLPDLVICNSHYTARAVSRLYPRAPAEVVYCPHELPGPTPLRTPESRAAVRAGLDTPHDAAVIIQVSRMESWKGHEAHLDALKALDGVDDLICWFVGGAQRPSEARYEHALRRRAERLGLAGRVRFAGQRADVPQLLAAADIFCQPNTEPEPFGLVFIEALRSGLPVVTTNLGGAREIVEESCGLLVPRGDVAALSAALRTLVENPLLRARLGGHGPGRAWKLCDPATQLTRLYDVLCGGARKKAAVTA